MNGGLIIRFIIFKCWMQNENMSKNDKSLKEWVDAQTKNIDKDKFLENHLIPDVDLELDNFEEYFEKRKELLIKELKKVLN